MPAVNTLTANYGFPLPNPTNPLEWDVLKLIEALTAVDLALKQNSDSIQQNYNFIIQTIGASPEAVNTIQELAQAINNDPQFFTNLPNTLVSRSGSTMTGALNWAPAVNVASATTTDLGAAASNHVTITGTTTITGFGISASGVERTVTFAGALTLTHNSASLVLPGGANITTAAGDVAEFVSLGGGNWRCSMYQKANGQAVVSPVMPTTQSLNRGAYLRETNNGTMVPNRSYGIWTGGGAIVMNMPALADCANGDEIVVSNLHSTWGIHSFTINCPTDVFFIRTNGSYDNTLVCDSNSVQGFTLRCAWNAGAGAGAHWAIVG